VIQVTANISGIPGPSSSHQTNVVERSAKTEIETEPITDHRDHPLTILSETIPFTAHSELRSILQMHADVQGSALTLSLKLDDLMNRQLTTQLAETDTPESLVAELVQFGLVAESDAPRVVQLLSATLLSTTTTRMNLVRPAVS